MKRWLVLIGALAAAGGTVLWFLLLMSASAETVVVARYYPHLVVLNVLVVLTLLALVGWHFRRLWQESRSKVFGARLKLRLMIMFGMVSVIPGFLVYAVSVQFITRSVDSWFDVRVEKALESGLNLGRTALDSLLEDLAKKARHAALEMSDKSIEERRSMVFLLREQTGAQAVTLMSLTGQMLVNDQGLSEPLLTDLPNPIQLRDIRSERLLSVIEGEAADQLRLRVLALVNGVQIGDEPQVLQILQPVPAGLAQNAEAVQGVYRDYQELQIARSGLTQIYALTLTLTVLVALFAAFALAFYLARRLSAPLYMLTQGTQAVAQGDFSSRLAANSRDELGGLTESFNEMTRQLGEARHEADRHRLELEAARAYLESILANLSAGVLVLDDRFVLRTLNEGALRILGGDFAQTKGHTLLDWPQDSAFGAYLREGFERLEDGTWESQYERQMPDGKTQTLLLRGTCLPQGNGGFVLVFDDVSELISAQRSAAWGEVARRLAHEIKNPLTPIQLSAERLQMRLTERLAESDAEMLARSTQTIINQVQAMKNMVDDFRDYARMPPPNRQPLDLNGLVREVLGLYESSNVRWDVELADELPKVLGDSTQLRQVIHNLLRNAEDALESRSDGLVSIKTEASHKTARLTIADNGPGFPAEILHKVFEPYVTTKPKGTGLGLPIVKKIIDEHQGRIEVINLPEGGARISLRLPFVQTQTAEMVERE